MIKSVFTSALVVLLSAGSVIVDTEAAAEPPSTVVSVRPLHSLVAAVMDGVAAPQLLIDGVQRPHSYNLSPSDAQALSDADFVVWVGKPLETFLERPLANLATNAQVIELANVTGLVLRENRDSAVWDSDSHDDHEHGHEDHHDHGHNHDHHKVDGHVWLDPTNARTIVDAVADALSKIDPENAARYDESAERTKARIDDVQSIIRDSLAPYRDRPFLTSHDSLQYFDRYFDLAAAGSITLTPDQAPSARRVADLRAITSELGAVCIFSEPGYEPKVIQVLKEGANVNVGVIDPLGINLSIGPELYFELMLGLSNDLAACLSSQVN